MVGRSSHRSHRSSLSRRSSLSHRTTMHKSSFKKHGISNAHAFAVGKSTGININGSALGAHGAALHRMRKMRNNNSIHRSSSISNRRFTSKNKSNFMKKLHVTSNKHHYTSKKYSIDTNKIGEEINNAVNEASKYIWIPILIFIIFFVGILFMFLFALNMSLRFF